LDFNYIFRAAAMLSLLICDINKS